MKNYHVVYKLLESDFFSKGENVEATDEIEALKQWRANNENAIFFAIYTTNL